MSMTLSHSQLESAKSDTMIVAQHPDDIKLKARRREEMLLQLVQDHCNALSKHPKPINPIRPCPLCETQRRQAKDLLHCHCENRSSFSVHGLTNAG